MSCNGTNSHGEMACTIVVYGEPKDTKRLNHETIMSNPNISDQSHFRCGSGLPCEAVTCKKACRQHGMENGSITKQSTILSRVQRPIT